MYEIYLLRPGGGGEQHIASFMSLRKAEAFLREFSQENGGRSPKSGVVFLPDQGIAYLTEGAVAS